MKKCRAEVVSKRKLCEGIYDIRLKTEIAPEAKSGQFILVFPNDPSKLLGRPLCICEAEGEEIRIVFRVSGAGTEGLADIDINKEIMIEGPLGNGWDLSAAAGKEVLLLCGGIGAPALLELSKRLCRMKGKTDGPQNVRAVLGYRDSSMNAFLSQDFKDSGADVVIATDDGSAGIKGNVIEAADKALIGADVIFACGPMPMLEAVKEYSEKNGIKAYISLEERMACGVGACLGCVVKTTEKDSHSHVNNARICTEGPVFDASEVVL
ncbi:MAG: dihydroorotate dehydrogenase electron transfer subunit [Lachnospiraceae bacterium]|nr:dihydroorotate dehydrogenase electron transfer subunit [Lachnospiraceae bacterium]